MVSGRFKVWSGRPRFLIWVVAWPREPILLSWVVTSLTPPCISVQAILAAYLPEGQRSLLKEMDSETYAEKDIAYPSIYNLIVDPKEEVPELNYLNDTWVDFPLYQVIEDHETSLANDPQLPVGD